MKPKYESHEIWIDEMWVTWNKWFKLIKLKNQKYELLITYNIRILNICEIMFKTTEKNSKWRTILSIPQLHR